MSGSSVRSNSKETFSLGADQGDTAVYNPRTEPRDHLRRMTVREALAESRTRGRSPNRRAINDLEKRIMNDGLPMEISNDKSLSTSLPHIPDQIQTDLDTKDNNVDVDLKAMTLNKSGKKRGHSEGRVAGGDTPTKLHYNRDSFQPLDKRKYIINKHTASISTKSTEPKSAHKNQIHTAEIHSSHSSRDPSPYSASPFAEHERQRRESFAKFLELRETRPPRSTSIGHLSTDPPVISEDHHFYQSFSDPDYVPHGQVSELNNIKETPPTYEEVMTEESIQARSKTTLHTSPTSKFRPVKPSATRTDSKSSNIRDDTTRPDQESSKGKGKIRSNYVSPRRFTKGSRKNISPNRSDTETKTVEADIKSLKQPTFLEKPSQKYQRKFSNSSEKDKRKISSQSIALQSNVMEGKTARAFAVIDPPVTTFHSSKLGNNHELPRPLPVFQTVSTENDDFSQIEKNEGKDFDEYEMDTGLAYMANEIRKAMDGAHNKSQPPEFSNSTFSAVPLDSITNSSPFQIENDNEKQSLYNNNETSWKNRSASIKECSISEFEPIGIQTVENILTQDDVFETNIDEVSIQSERKAIEGENCKPTSESGTLKQPYVEKVSVNPDSRHSSESSAKEMKTEVCEFQSGINTVETDKDITPIKENKKLKKRKSKIEKNFNSSVNVSLDPEASEKETKQKKNKKERRKSKSKKRRSMSDLDSSNTGEITEPKSKPSENDKVTEVNESIQKQSIVKPSKRKSVFRRTRHSVPKTRSIHEAIVKVGRAASLSNILDSPELSRATRKPSLVKTGSLKRSHSVEEVASLEHNEIEQFNLNIPDSVFCRRSAKDAIWNIETEVPKVKDRKSQPKLSLSAIVSLKAKVRRFKKAKQAKEQADTEVCDKANTPDTEKVDENTAEHKDQSNEINESGDKNRANVVYENEINVGLIKINDPPTETALIEDDLDNEIANIVHEKTIHFDSYINEQHLSEEELIKQRQRNTRLTGRRESKVRQRQKRVISCCKKLIAFLFSHIGLCSLVVAYCIAGGFIFKQLEGTQELAKKKEMQKVRTNYTNQIYSLAFENKFTKRSAKEFRKQVESILMNYSLKIYRETKEAGWDGKDSTSEPEQWSFPSSLLYAITVMTTIGKLSFSYYS